MEMQFPGKGKPGAVWTSKDLVHDSQVVSCKTLFLEKYPKINDLGLYGHSVTIKRTSGIVAALQSKEKGAVFYQPNEVNTMNPMTFESAGTFAPSAFSGDGSTLLYPVWAVVLNGAMKRLEVETPTDKPCVWFLAKQRLECKAGQYCLHWVDYACRWHAAHPRNI